MKILFITPTLPTMLSRIRAYNILKCLAKNHEVHLLSFIDSEVKKKKIGPIRKFCASVETVLLPKYRSYLNCLLYLFTPTSLRVAYYKSKKMQRKIKAILKDWSFDLVYIERERMAQYGEAVGVVPKILDLCDAQSLMYKRAFWIAGLARKFLYLEEYVKLLRYEIDISKQFDRTMLCSPVDLEFLKENSPKPLRNLVSIPLGVDTEFYYPKRLEVEENSILFSGVMSVFVNIDAVRYFCREIFPLIREKSPDVKLYLVGPNPPNSIRGLAKDSRIVVTGYADDLRDYVEKAAVVVCPVRVGAGIRNKICQPLAIKKAVVSTSLGAEGLGVVDGEHLLIADEPKDFAEKVARLLKDKPLRERLGQKGCEFIKLRYSLERVGEDMNSLLEEIMLEKKAGDR